jgi:hypothetical protein
MNRESPANSEFEIRKNDEAPAFTKANGAAGENLRCVRRERMREITFIRS